MESYKSKVLLETNKALKFEDFSLTYLRQFDPEEHSEVKTTASIQKREFKIEDESGKELIFTINHGQLPPGPYELEFSGQKYTLYTYQSPNREQLFPDHIYIEKK